MRVLRFIVRGQSLQKDPSCDFSSIASGSQGYLEAEFVFDSAWRGCAVIASFWHFDKESAVIVKNNRCEIPSSALTGLSVGVSLIGVRDGYRVTTNRVKFEQEVS